MSAVGATIGETLSNFAGGAMTSMLRVGDHAPSDGWGYARDALGALGVTGAVTSIAGALPAGTQAAGGAGSVGLDTNALIARLEGGAKDVEAVVQAMAGRSPSVSITAAKEFLTGGGSVEGLRAFLQQAGGRIGQAVSRATLQRLQGLGLKPGDARVVGSAVDEGITVLTRDRSVLNKVPEVAERF
jgi:hypothetical protein